MKNQIKLLLGAMAFAAFQTYGQNLVLNPGFETGDFTDWTQTDNTGFTGVTGGQYAHTGDFGGFFGAVGSAGGIEQTLSVSATGLYDVSFWLYNDGGGSVETANVSFGGTTLLSLDDSSGIDGGFPYTEYTYDNVAGGNGVLSFEFQQDPAYFGLDDVSVTAAVPDTGSTMAMMSVAFLGLGAIARRFRR